jgi:UDP-2-acetamido-3-amino-2,3-dideoxy-glucuronate N-acetyltransferase
MDPSIEISNLVDSSAVIGHGVRIWHNSQIRDKVVIGADCIIGRNVYVGSGVRIGQNCKIQNNALIYEPAVIGDGVFIGPAVVLTNDQYPRAINPDLTLKSADDWIAVGVSIGTGASIGAGAICVAPISIGDWSMVAAGSVVTRNVPNFALVAGVPARQIGWVGKLGYKLTEDSGTFKCPSSGHLYVIHENTLREVS